MLKKLLNFLENSLMESGNNVHPVNDFKQKKSPYYYVRAFFISEFIDH